MPYALLLIGLTCFGLLFSTPLYALDSELPEKQDISKTSSLAVRPSEGATKKSSSPVRLVRVPTPAKIQAATITLNYCIEYSHGYLGIHPPPSWSMDCSNPEFTR